MHTNLFVLTSQGNIGYLYSVNPSTGAIIKSKKMDYFTDMNLSFLVAPRSADIYYVVETTG